MQGLEELLVSALVSLGGPEKLPFKIDPPPRPEFGDYATNAAIPYARLLNLNPLEFAQSIAEKLQELDQGKIIKEIRIAKPGFINLFIREEFIQQSLFSILRGECLGEGKEKGNREKILLEFVSANPTGPLHVGHGRWAVIGDVIARLLSAVGNQVETEFYINNVGNQVNKLWDSIVAARNGSPVPEGGYGGEYIKEVTGQNKNEALEYLLNEQKETLETLRVNFDRYYRESDLHSSNKVQEAIARLNLVGKTFQEDGALWFKSQEMGDDKNRVLVRADGQSTYFASDIAYHLDKFERGYDRLINIWGTDHHGYVNRLKSALRSAGQPDEKMEIIIGQLVTLYRGNEPIRMSKRTGEMVTLEEVIDEIGVDAVRFFFAATDVNSHLDFDLELAKKQSNENPVYYVQYAHARICSILNKSKQQTSNFKGEPDLSTLIHPAEKTLMLKLISWPDIVHSAARLRHPHRLTEYAKELATTFHHFYEKCRVIGDPARLVLVDASRITLRNVLELLGISAPESM